MTKFNYTEFKNIKNRKERSVYLAKEIDGVDPSNPLELSDALSQKNSSGAWVLQALGNKQQDMLRGGQYEGLTKWKLEVLSDEWGNTVGPGDVVVRKVPKYNTLKQLKAKDALDRNVSLMNGTYDEEYNDYRKFVVDKKGCIECTFDDAVYFLNTKGVHFFSGKSLAGESRDSVAPMTAPNGQELKKQNWLYREVTSEAYKNLKNRDKRVRPLNGVDSIDKIKAYAKKIKKAGTPTTAKQTEVESTK